MPNVYEQAHSCLNYLIPNAGADPDFDTKANLLEYAKGSDPCSGDTDGDSLADNIDKCQLSAEDFDGYQDGDGCPDYDNDSDGICDAHFAPGPPLPLTCLNPVLASPRYDPPYPGGPAPDRCGNVPEDFDGYKDLDGCPEPDNDGDGFPDSTDQCPGTDYTAGPDGIADSGDEPLDSFGVPIRTKEDYDGIVDTDGCHDSPTDDYDGDGLSDENEVLLYGTDPTNRDTDGDGCRDGREVGSDPTQGGQRDPLNPWDYFNPTHDGTNRSDDITAVVMKYGHDQGVFGDYDVRYDRTALMGGHPWQFGPPDGTIRTADISAAVRSYGHDCS